jgi:hypothetical protein
VEEHEIVAVEEQFSRGGGTELWKVRFARPDGTFREHFFPKMTLDARAAEYGIDPDDVDTLLDIVLAEPFIPDPTKPANYAADVAARDGLTVAAVRGRDEAKTGQAVPVWLFNAESTAQAREAHLARVAEVRRSRVKVVTGKAAGKGLRAAADPLDKIRTAHRPDHALIAEIKQAVRAERQRLRGEPAADDITTGETRG